MSHPLPQSRLIGKGRARVTKPIGIFNRQENRIGSLSPGEEVELKGTPDISAQDIRWWLKDSQGRELYSFEYRRGEYFMEPIASPPPTGGTQWYTVKENDTWWGIAQKYNTTVEALKALNQGSGIIRPGDVLHVGDRMRVPA